MTAPQWRGAHTALITPFQGDAVDYKTFRSLLERQIAGGISGVVPVGTTGESPTLDTHEHLEVIRVAAETVAGRVPVIAGTGANSTSEALHLTKEADRLGADAFLQVAPYYNKPSAEGLFRHFAAIAEVTEKPIVLYSVPGRCGIEIPVSVVKRLLDAFPHVNVIKEAGGSVARVQELRHVCGDALTILSGDDGLTLPFIAAGAVGVISVASNLAPKLISRLTALANAGDFAAARELSERYYPFLTDCLFLEGNPVAIKTGMELLGVIPNGDLRLPLAPMAAANRERLRSLYATLDLSDDVA
jgi:4-hydroxy-tetrahydrodipicolinate synthase